MRVKIRTFARFRELFGKERLLDVPEGTTVQDAVEAMCTMVDESRQEVFNEDRTLKNYIILIRNGKRIDLQDANSISLIDGDDIALFPPVSGG